MWKRIDADRNALNTGGQLSPIGPSPHTFTLESVDRRPAVLSGALVGFYQNQTLLFILPETWEFF